LKIIPTPKELPLKTSFSFERKPGVWHTIFAVEECSEFLSKLIISKTCAYENRSIKYN